MDDKWECNWGIYCNKAKAVLYEAGLHETIEIDNNRKGRTVNSMHVYIKPFPLKGNKRKMELLSKINGFHGIKYLQGERYMYYGYLEVS